MALPQIQKAIDTMSVWADKINSAFNQIDTNQVDINGHNSDIASNLTAIGVNQIDIADNVTAIGVNTAGVATNVTAIGLNTAGVATLDGEMDTAEGRLDVLEAAPPKMGWIDYNDLATVTTPIPLTVAGTFYKMTNDGAGAFSNNTYKIAAHGEIWNTTTDTFDFSDVPLGSTVDFRVDITVTTSGVNRDVTARLALGQGASPYTLNIGVRSFKLAGSYQITRWYSIYIADANTRDNGGHFEVSSDNTGDSVVVNGWYVRTQLR